MSLAYNFTHFAPTTSTFAPQLTTLHILHLPLLPSQRNLQLQHYIATTWCLFTSHRGEAPSLGSSFYHLYFHSTLQLPLTTSLTNYNLTASCRAVYLLGIGLPATTLDGGLLLPLPPHYQHLGALVRSRSVLFGECHGFFSEVGHSSLLCLGEAFDSRSARLFLCFCACLHDALLTFA